LKSILQCRPSHHAVRCVLDHRAHDQLSGLFDGSADWVRPTVVGRIQAQVKLWLSARKGDTIVCFNGMPPLLPTDARVVIFVQNRLQVVPPEKSTVSGFVALRLRAERLCATHLRGRVDHYVVQTKSMEDALVRYVLNRGAVTTPISVVPFCESLGNQFIDDVADTPKWDFLYVADGLPHKNHAALLRAWELLAEQGLRPSLALTVADADPLAKVVAESCRAQELKITNLGSIPHSRMRSVYAQAGALIYPSFAESFGLPLIEATEAGIPIVAAERDYVRDVCQPSETFDPASPRSIERAVRRFLDKDTPPAPINSASAFWTAVFNDGST